MQSVGPIHVEDAEYRLVLNEHGVVYAVDAIVGVSDPSEWPTVTADPSSGVKVAINSIRPRLDRIKTNLRTVQGLLALYGLEQIDLDFVDENWEPESDEERSRLDVFRLSRSRSTRTDDDREYMAFDIVARAFLASNDALPIQIALSFNRKGFCDFLKENHIEAIYNYYFMLESLYATGKTKNHRVEEAIRNSVQFQAAVSALLSQADPIEGFAPTRKVREDFAVRYSGKTPREVAEHLVRLRGFLHHHTAGRPGMWHPEEHEDYAADAMFLVLLAHNICWQLSKECMFSDLAVERYRSLLRKNGAQ